MPQAEQVQTYYWGALRADAIDLAVDGINVATGPNGSGKTTSLDSLKLVLGVSDLSRRPADYIFDGGGNSHARGDRALIKVIFANPERPGRAGRVFSDAGRGCESSAHVTAICDIHRDGRRRYAILPGALHWGQNGSDLEADINDLRTLIPANQWMKPRAWDELLARAGVSRALRGVIAVKQGETDKTIEGTPEMLLKRVLELTGKQETLEEFREARGQAHRRPSRLRRDRRPLRRRAAPPPHARRPGQPAPRLRPARRADHEDRRGRDPRGRARQASRRARRPRTRARRPSGHP